MRIVLDTNTVIASGWKSESVCRRVLDLVFYGKKADCYVSLSILREYTETAQDRKFRHIRRDILRQVRRVRRNAHRVEPEKSVSILVDPDDDKFLELVQAVEADYLVTGDLEAFGQIRIFGRTRIVTPREFLDILDAA